MLDWWLFCQPFWFGGRGADLRDAVQMGAPMGRGYFPVLSHPIFKIWRSYEIPKETK